MMNSKIDRYWKEQERKSLMRGFSATFNDGRLEVFDSNGEPFHEFSVGATRDWMSGNFSFKGRVVLQWDRGRRKKRDPRYDSWNYHGQVIADMINRYGKGLGYE